MMTDGEREKDVGWVMFKQFRTMLDTLDNCMAHVDAEIVDPEIKEENEGSAPIYLAQSLYHDACEAMLKCYELGKIDGGEP
jgi:hypothetical protein